MIKSKWKTCDIDHKRDLLFLIENQLVCHKRAVRIVLIHLYKINFGQINFLQ